MSAEPNPSPPPASVQARSLAAWMPVEDGRRPDDGPGSDAWSRRAATVLAQRPAIPDQAALLEPLPAELADHIRQLRQTADARRMFDQDWEPALITDLRLVIAAQRTIVVDSWHDTIPLSADLPSLARLTLPLKRPAGELPAEFDPQHQVWKITSRNPNMRITGRFGGELRAGAFGFGFVVEVLTSFVSVAEYRGRFILRDGYHRAYRLLNAGIVTVPALVRRFTDDERVFSTEMLPEAAWTGDHPPLLGDFTDDRLAHDVWLPDADTTLYVNAMPPRLALDRGR